LRAAGRRAACLLLLLATLGQARAVTVPDDSGREVHLDAPAQRIISLAPHITELLYAAGAGDHIVGTVQYSDYPPAARAIPRLGDTYDLDMERLLALAPDLIIIWRSGTRQALIDAVRRTGVPVYLSGPSSLAGIATDIRRFGALAGTGVTADRAGDRFLRHLAALHRRYSGRAPVRMFYQFWQEPIYTVSGAHFVSRVISLCGGVNVFAGLPVLTPRVTTEAVLAADPAVIIASGAGAPQWLDDWRDWPQIRAVRNDQLYAIPPDLLLRPTPRLLDGAARMCRDIDLARREKMVRREE